MFFPRGVLQSAKFAVQRRSNPSKDAACLLSSEINHQAQISTAMMVYDAESQSLDRAPDTTSGRQQKNGKGVGP